MGVKMKRVRDVRGKGKGRDWRTKWQKQKKKEDWGGGPRRDVIVGEEQQLSSQKPLSAATCCEGSPFALIHRHLQEGQRHIAVLQVLT